MTIYWEKQIENNSKEYKIKAKYLKYILQKSTSYEKNIRQFKYFFPVFI